MSQHRRRQGSSNHRPGRRKPFHAHREKPSVPLHEVPFTEDELKELRKELVVDPDWDLILVGDGSVDNDTKTCGWAVTLFDRAAGTKKTFFGAASSGSCLLGELMPYAQAILWFSRFKGRKLLKQKPRIKAYIATDSQIIASQGSSLKKFMADARRIQVTRPLWITFDQLAGMGYEFNWKWVKRGVLEANRDMNRLAQAVRWKMSRVLEKEEEEDDGE